MKKILLTLLPVIAMQFSHAQDKPELPMSIIISGGVNLATMAYNDYYFFSTANPGLSGSAMLRTDGDIFVMAGLQYVNANPTMTDKIVTGSVPEEISFQFLQLPVMIGLHLVKSPESTRTLRTQLGASFSTILSVSENNLGITKEVINSTLLTFRAGIGADLGNFVADINYNLLVSNLYDAAGYDNKGLLKCFEFMVGYKINLGKSNED